MTYHTNTNTGFPVGYPLDQNRQPQAYQAYISPNDQPRHICLAGSSGSGKSTLFETALYHNWRATDGADIVFDSKGDGLPTEYQQIHYASESSLDNVYHFDLEREVPALSFFDVRPLVEAGLPRPMAVESISGHYLEIARATYGREQFDAASRAARLLRSFVRAAFDPVNGADVFGHDRLRRFARQFKTHGEMPPVSDPHLKATLDDYTEMPTDMRQNVADAVIDRLSTVTDTPQLDAMLRLPAERTTEPATDSSTEPASDDADTTAAPNSDPDATPTASELDAVRFDLRAMLDADVIVIVDTGGLPAATAEPVTLVLLSTLWRACQRRKRRPGQSLPLANIYLEEAGVFSGSTLLRELLPLARSFNVGFVLIPQYPGQLQADDRTAMGDDIGLLNNIGAVITGSVPKDRALIEYFAGAHLDRSEVEAQLDTLARGQWLVDLPAAFGAEPLQPFVTESPPLPPGHPEGPYPLTDSSLAAAFETARSQRRDTLRDTVARPLESTSGTPTQPREPPVSTDESLALQRHNLLPRTQRLPACVSYDPDRHCVVCEDCATTYQPTLEGVIETVRCCHRLQDVDRDDIPVVACHPIITPEERQAADLSAGQVCFLQAVHEATHQRHDPRAFDLVTDSMVRLREYTGIDPEAITDLCERGLLTEDTSNTPHRVYSLTPDGRDTLNISLTTGRDYGDGVGDLSESALHRLAVAVGRRYLYAEFVADPDSPVVEAVTYHPVADDKRLDAAGLTDEGVVHVALEAERTNNDLKEAVPADFDTMAACEPAEAVWIVMDRAGSQAVLEALNDPADGPPRVEKTYGNTPPRQFNIETPGCSEMYTVSWLAKQYGRHDALDGKSTGELDPTSADG